MDLHYFREQPQEISSAYNFTRFVPLIKDVNAQDPQLMEVYSPIIEFTTHRISSYLATGLFRDHRKWGLRSFSNPFVVGRGGDIIGYLDLDTNKLSGLSSTSEVELISIGSMIGRGIDSMTPMFEAGCYLHRDCKTEYCQPGDTGCNFEENWEFKFYNVLWMEWEDGIAYRKAIGKVWADYWESADKEEIDIRLG